MTDAVLDLVNLRDAVVASLKGKIPGLSIEAHGGSFSRDEIKRFALKAPCIRVALLGFGQTSRAPTGEIVLPVHFVAACVAKDRLVEGGEKVGRDAGAALIANAVALAVAGNRFGLSGVHQPKELRGENLYSGEVDTTGLALWQVTWTTPARLGDSVDEAIAAIAQLLANGVLYADPLPVEGADPLPEEVAA